MACRKLKALLSEEKRLQAGGYDWLDVSFAVLADEYLEDSKARKKHATYVSRRYRILRAMRILGKKVRTGELRKYHLSKIEQKLAKNDYSPTTINDTLAAVQAVLHWAVSQDLLDVNPLAGYKKPRPRRRTVDGPVFIGRRLSPIHFEIGSWTDAFDQFSDACRIAAMFGAFMLDPAPDAFILKRHVAPNAKEHEFV